MPFARSAAPTLDSRSCTALAHFAVDAQLVEPEASAEQRLAIAARLMTDGLAVTPERAWRQAGDWMSD